MKSKTAIATFWSLSDTFANVVLKFIFAIAITRLLFPRDYGLVAYTGLFLGIATWLSDWGFGTALIQKKEASDLDFSTGFLSNVVISLLFFFLYFVSASLVADFFNEPELKNILRATSLNLVLNALCYIHQIKLIKERQFKGITVTNFISSVISGSIGLAFAYGGYHYWALIVQTLTGTLLRMFGLWYLVKWIPVLKFSWVSFKEQFSFGSKVFIQGLLESIFREIQSLIIGKTYHTSALGNYSRGQKFYDLFVVQIGIAFNKVLYPTMVLKNGNHISHRDAYIKTYRLLFFIMAPLSLFLILLSKPIILVLLTDKWVNAVPYMRLYCIAGFVFLLSYFNATTTLSSNRPGLYLFIDVFQKFLIGISLLITFKLGISAIVIGWLTAYYIYYISYEIVMFKLGFYNTKKYMYMLQTILCLLPMVAFYFLSYYFISDPFLLLLINAIIQPILFFISNSFLKTEALAEFRAVIVPFFK